MQIGDEVRGEQTPWASFLGTSLASWSSGAKGKSLSDANRCQAFKEDIKAVSIHCLVQHKGRRLLVTSLGG